MKKIFLAILSAFIVLFLLPFLAVKFANSNAAMILCFVLFFAVNPVFSIISGIYAGLDIKRMWFMPFTIAIIYLFSSWIFFDFGEKAFIIYAAFYFFVCTISMLTVYSVKKFSSFKKGND